MGAMKLTSRAFSSSAQDRKMQPIWAPGEESPKRKRSRTDNKRLQEMIRGMSSLPSGLLDFGGGVMELGKQKLRSEPHRSPPPFSARRTLFNNVPESSERRYASCELPFAAVKAIARATGTTVNDVMMTLIDDALHRYLRDCDAPAEAPLVTLMAMSFRSGEHGSEGNQVSQELVVLGEPDAKLRDRLDQVHNATSKVKEESGSLPVAVRQMYSLFLSGTGTLPELSRAFESIPNYNLIISNMVGPREQLYLAGAPMVISGGLPIVPPGCGLNVTFGSVNKSLSLAIGAGPEAVKDPGKITAYIERALAKLEKATTTK
jgi:WS/DGAT/MGAT family acyltransferase